MANPEDIERFELLLHNRASKQLLTIYAGDKNAKLLNRSCVYTANDIISAVKTNLKAIQTADSVKSDKINRRKFIKYKRNSFLSVNSLIIQNEEPKPALSSKFETQCVSDTQLIDVIDKAEAIMQIDTQEFGTSFCCNSQLKFKSNTVENVDKDMWFGNNTSPENIQITNKEHKRLSPDILEMVEDNNLYSNMSAAGRQSITEKADINISETPTFTCSIGLENNPDNLGIVIEEIKQPHSPILNTIKHPSPHLVYNLDDFEKFEKVAIALLFTGPDIEFDKEKFITQLKISESELTLNSESDNQKNEPLCSPILNRNMKNKENIKTTTILNESSEIISQETNIKDNFNLEYKTPKLEDNLLNEEIIFSSDEENDYVHNNFQELPLTCALETSFYNNQSGILDETIFVGFQTASNKSIQISVDSFVKAQEVYNELDDKDNVKSAISLNELVEQCDKSECFSKINVGEIDTINESRLVDSLLVIRKATSNSKTNTSKTQETVNTDQIIKHLVPFDSGIKRTYDIDNFENVCSANNKYMHSSHEGSTKAKKAFEGIELDQKRVIDHSNSHKIIEGMEIEFSSNKDHFDGFETVCKNITHTDKHNIPKHIMEQAKHSSFKGFNTASNKKIIVSEQALAITRNVFKNIDLSEQPDIENEDDLFLEEFNTELNDVLENVDAKCEKTVLYKSCNEKLSSTYKITTNKNYETICHKDISKQDTKSTGIFTENKSETKNKSDNIQKNSIYDSHKSYTGFKPATNKEEVIMKEALNKADMNEVNELAKIGIFRNCSGSVTEESAKDVIGFQTASNKKICISDKALAKTKKLFEDIELNERNINEMATTKTTNLVGFQTASDKKISISEVALAKTKEVFRDIQLSQQNVQKDDGTNKMVDFIQSETAKINAINIFHDKNDKNKKILEEFTKVTEPTLKQGKEKSRTSFGGFQTTNNINIIIYEEALAKAKNVFDYIELSQQNLQEDDSFQSANNNKIKISDKALVKTKRLLGDNRLNETKNPFNETEKTKTADFGGFKTASDKDVRISEVSLKKAKEVFKDIDLIQQNEDATNKAVDFVGFQTATNKNVNISEVTNVKTNKVFKEFRNFSHPKQENSKTNLFVGFQTANNNKVHVSEKALAKAKNVFGDIELSQQNPQQVDETTKISNFIGFQTASNNKVETSEDALAKSKKIFEDLEFSQTSLTKIAETTKRTTFVGFQTASNKKVCISETALAQSKKVFEDIKLSQQNDEENDRITKIANFDGFQTASQKKNYLSEHALVKSEKEFKDIEFSQPKSRKIEDTSKTTSFVEYKTGNNKKVDIPEEPLEKTLNLFNDIKLNVNCEAIKTKGFLCFNTANNRKVSVSENALAKTKNIFENVEHSNQIQAIKEILSHNKETDNVDVNPYINTQILNNFDESLNTEDFFKSPKIFKRSISPILSCPKAKKRKIFQTPYKLKSDTDAPMDMPAIARKSKDMFILNEQYKKTKILKLKNIDLLEKSTESAVIIDPYILNFKFDTLLGIEFDKERNDISNKKLTIEDLKEIFIDNVDRKIVPDNWLDNHLKLILWKLLSYEIRFPETMKNICSAKAVLKQLKWRYEKELYKVERPALRKILEKDDLPSRTIVLCVVSIFQDGENVNRVTSISKCIELMLTDGWYCVKASIDNMLSRLVFDSKIKIGSKIVTCGAEILNCDQGVSPWEDTSKVRLKLFGNSTRRAAWDARLGYHGNAAIFANLSTVKVDGGKVAKTKLFVARVYPLLYVEKFEDGSTVTRSERLEQIYQMKYETERQMIIEKIYEEMEKEFSDQSSQDSDTVAGSSGKRRCMETGSQIAKMMKRSRDPAEFTSHLTESQNESLEEHNIKQREKLLLKIQDKMQERISKTNLSYNRKVVTLLKLRVSGLEEKNGVLEVTKGMMSLWKPSDAILDLLKEGAWIDVLNVVPTAVRCSEIQLSAGRQSSFNRAKMKMTPKIEAYAKNIARNCTSIKNLLQIPHQNSDYNEIDTIGLIFLIDPSNIAFEKESNKNQHFQNVYFADQEKNIICVNFWGGIKKFGFENIIDVGQIVACVNLQKRLGNTRKNIPQYRVTEFTYFTKTPKNLNARNMIENFVKQFNGIDRRKFCQDCVDLKSNFNVIKYQNNENISPYRFSTTDYNLSKNKIFIESPLAQKSKKEVDDLNLTGLDFESTFKQKDTQDMSPELLKRKQLVKDKIARLKMYGEPPPLCPIYITNRSKSASNSYKSPLISNNKSNIKVENPNTTPKSTINNKENSVASISENDSVTRIQKENLSSPVIPYNRSYVNRPRVNPVKLNFSNNVSLNQNDDSVDHFAEEFESSPPLSLD